MKQTWILQDKYIKHEGQATFLRRQRGTHWYNTPDPKVALSFDSKLDAQYFMVDNNLEETYLPTRFQNQ